MKKLLVILSLAALVFGCAAPQQEHSALKPEVRFKDGKLRIAQFTDVHWSDEESDARLPHIISSVVRSENPDLIVFTGDVVTGIPVKEGWTKFVELMHGLGIPYAVTMGNHDPEAPSTSDPTVVWERQETRDSIFSILETSHLFVGERGPSNLQGMGNYVVPVLASDGSDKVGALLYCMDSYDYYTGYGFAGSYGWFSFEQILWYREQSRSYTEANGGRPLPALAFFHIPLPEHAAVKPLEGTIGNMPENVYSGDVNSGMFCSMFEMGDVMGVFVGHDHNNDYIGQLGRIALGYGKSTGVDSYGQFEKGGRIIDIYEGQRYFDTWLCNENGVRENKYYYPSAVSDAEAEKYEIHPAHDVQPQEKGVAYRYYEGPFVSVMNFETEGKLMEEGVMPAFDISGAKASDHFGYEFDCWFEAPQTDLYKFHMSSDDGAVLTIDGKVVIDLDGSHSTEHKAGQIRLEKGFHEFELRYFDDSDRERFIIEVVGRRLNGFEDRLFIR